MRLRVLVVDDNVELAENIAELLQDLDDQLDVVFSRGTRGAMDIAVRSGFDIALVDIRLSAGDDGLTLLPKLRELCPMGEVILMTGHGTLDSAITALRQGAFAYVLKPFDPQDFMELGGRALVVRRELNMESEGVGGYVYVIASEPRVLMAYRASADLDGEALTGKQGADRYLKMMQTL